MSAAAEAAAIDPGHKRWALGIVTALILISAGTYAYHEYYLYLSVYLWFGFIYGMCLQYGRFCFSSAFRDLFAVGVPRMAVGIMIAIALFGLVGAFVSATGLSTFHAAPTSVHAVIAGFIFGVGMCFSGGCASGSMYKTGEGNMNALLVVLSISVTQAIFVDVGGWTNALVPASWTQSALGKGLPASITVTDGWVDQYLAGYVWDQPVMSFATLFGWTDKSVLGAFVGNLLVGVALPGAALLAVVYAFWSRRGFMRKRVAAGAARSGWRDELAGYWAMIVASKRTAIAGLALGIAAGLHMYATQGLRVKFGVRNAGPLLERMGSDFGLSVNGTVFDPGYWYVTTQEAQWVGWVMHKLGWNQLDNIYFGFNNGIPNPLINPADWMSIALFFGAAVMALLHREFKFKTPTLETATWAIIGGALMGIGSRLGLGCNVGAFFVRVSQGDPSGWLFGAGMVGGAYLGVKFFNWWTERRMARQFA
ncbi:MAG: YeeE/YedE family protein [Betaproteobacteria bacterium]|nr:MAG: YeeE/YedE family protein [Betaproteobacteria bacterium]